VDDQVAVAISFSVMIGLNLVAAVLIWAEYAVNRASYLRSIAIAQSFALLWHFVSLWIVADSDNLLAFNVSASAAFIYSLYFLSGALFDRSPKPVVLVAISIAYSTITIGGTFLSPIILNWAWIATMGVCIAIPIASILNFPTGVKWLIAILQSVNGFALVVGVILLGSNSQVLGGLLYFVSAIIVPLISVTYIIVSVRLSKLEITEKEKQYRIFFEAVNEVFFTTDTNGCIKSSSPSITQYGIETDKFIGTNISDYLFDPDNFIEKLNVANSFGEPFQYLGSFRTKSGFMECEIVCTPIKDKNKEELEFAGAIRNTHERTLLEQQFIEAERHKSLAVLAGGIAHDFNNILQGIVGHAEILAISKEISPQLKNKTTKAILNATNAAGNLCRQLLQYTGKGAGGKEDIDLVTTLNNVIDIINPSHLGDINIELDLLEDAAVINGDKSQIAQIFLNLIRNSIDAVGDKGEIKVSLHEIVVDRDNHQELQLLGNIRTGKYFVISVKDNGTGIPESIRPRIFEPFFSTKSSGHGLGLAAVTGILKTHQGEVIVDSTQDVGTEIKIFLPSLNRTTQVDVAGNLEPSEESKLILLVDDEEEIRVATSTILESAGNRVVMAKDGEQALNLLTTHEEKFNLVITDIKMPNMDGVTLARKTQEIAPSLPVILTTGYADVSDQLTSSESLQYQFIRKPYRAEELLQAISEAS